MKLPRNARDSCGRASARRLQMFSFVPSVTFRRYPDDAVSILRIVWPCCCRSDGVALVTLASRWLLPPAPPLPLASMDVLISRTSDAVSTSESPPEPLVVAGRGARGGRGWRCGQLRQDVVDAPLDRSSPAGPRRRRTSCRCRCRCRLRHPSRPSRPSAHRARRGRRHHRRPSGR